MSMSYLTKGIIRPLTLSLIIILAFTCFHVGASAAATEETGDPGDEVLIRSDMEEEAESGIAKDLSDEEERVAELNAIIEDCAETPPEYVTRDTIIAAHDLYESLSMAGKSQVIGYDIIEGYIERLRIEFQETTTGEDTKRTDSGKILNDSYTFTVPEGGVSMTVYYVTDRNGDGKADEPDIAVVSPDNERTELQHGIKTVESEDISMSLSWFDDFMQMDIDSAKNGTWRLETSSDAVLNLFEYSGAKKSGFEPAAESGETVEPSSADEQEGGEKKSVFLSLLPLLLFIILTPAVLIGLSILLKKRNDPDKGNGFGKKRSGEKKKAGKNSRLKDSFDDYYDEDEEDEREKSEKEEMRAMARFLKNQQVSAEYDDEAADEDDVSVREEMMEQALAEADEEEGLEEFTEYPSGMIEKEEADNEDDGFGSRV